MAPLIETGHTLMEDILSAIVPIVIAVIWILVTVGKGLFGEKEPEQPAERQRPANRPPQVPRQGEPQREQVEDEVEQFLRRVRETRTEGGQRSRQSYDDPEVTILEPVPPEPPSSPVAGKRPDRDLDNARQRRKQEQRRQKEQAARRKAQAEAATNKPPEKQLSRMESERSQRFAREAGSLIDQPVTLLGGESLTSGKSSRQRPPATAAVGLATMLGSKANLRQAIILSEIFQRPANRWEE